MKQGATRKAYLANLLSSPSSNDDEQQQLLAGPEFHDFDFAGVGLGFHHFDDPSLASRRLAERLRPGGVLFIMDFLPHGSHEPAHGHNHHHGDGHGHGHGHDGSSSSNNEHAQQQQDAEIKEEDLTKHGVKHLGFTRESVKAMFEQAGAGGDFGWRELPEPMVLKHGDRVMRRDIFFARGTKN